MEDKRLDEETGDVYYGASCLTKYWIYNDEHKCIAYGKIDNKRKDLQDKEQRS
jgi:hypothetical protein